MIHRQNKRLVLFALVGIAVIVFLTLVNAYAVPAQHVAKHVAVKARHEYMPSFNEETREDKWIVITSIHGPTPAVLHMGTFVDYRVVIVLDEVSPVPPPNTATVTYLTLADQRALNFRTAEHTPLNSYTRKNIGYLYAISNGAREIYDTDDDNFINAPPRRRDTNAAHLQSCVPASSHLARNPYAAFGHPEIWPRGFPLEHTALECTGRGSFRGADQLPIANASIWQGLADLDPDVDAVFRMTHTNVLRRVIFPRRPPVYVGHDAFAPFNSQNTQFFYDAFFALYLPSSVAFRLTDIWRGYFAQKLMRYTGQHVAFVGPTVAQHRNAHDYLADFVDERQMYEQTASLLQFLNAWTPPPSAHTLFDIAAQLADDMAAAGFWGHSEPAALRAWLTDLRDLNYVQPPIVVPNKEPRIVHRAEPFALCAGEFDGQRLAFDVQRWFDTQQNQPMPATFAVLMDTRGFGAYVYDILFSSSFLLQNRSVAYSARDTSAYDSSFCGDGARGLPCFIDAPTTHFSLSECSKKNGDARFCSILSDTGHSTELRGMIAGSAHVQIADTVIVPEALQRAGWSAHHWFGFLARQFTRPNVKMEALLNETRAALGWRERERCVAVHIRRSDKIIEYVGHTYAPISQYVDEVVRLSIEHPTLTSIFVTSDNDAALAEFARSCAARVPNMRLMVNNNQTRFNGRECGDKTGKCPSRNYLTDPDERRAWAVHSMVDFFLLSSCEYLVGNFASFFTKAAAYRMFGAPNVLAELHGEDRFRSIDNDDSLQVWSPPRTVTFDIPMLNSFIE